MAPAAALSTHDVHARLNYLASITSGEPPFACTHPPSDGTAQTNVVWKLYPAMIHDVRGKEDTVSLDTTGFAFLKHVSEEKNFIDEKAITSKYYKEVEDLLRKEAGANRVFIFDHTISKHTELTANLRTRVHVDQSFEGGIARVRRHLPEDADRLLQGRVRIINVWRPIANPVAHHPLASNQTPDEVVLVKCFDTDETPGRARLTPHTAFLDTRSPADAPQRQLIEIRALVFDRE
ncbi:hypothetical protein FA95DRAFT_1580738 [Auriscalpium vulgare]|uniref:Uncharacterized protein n=1 Tax=Auriscalpium vulgare TaxID=40419 RepID=A0ACB8S4S5_9AGAM|nr:hypothetical protein FA95DRAFT_1580738 [Auriscalpium vulgare]